MRSLVLVVGAAVAACGILDPEPQSRTVLGYLEFYGDTTVPELKVSTDGSVAVTFTTYGGGCHSADRTSVRVAGDSVHVEPWDDERLGDCERNLVLLPHTATFDLGSRDEVTVVIEGRRAPGDDVVRIETVVRRLPDRSAGP